MNNFERYNDVLSLIEAARDYPPAQNAAEHLKRGQDVYKLLHAASDIIVLELIREARFEQDIHLHERFGDGN